MSYTRRPFNPLNPYQNQVVNELSLANDNFDLLAQAFVNNDPSTGKVLNAQNADSATNAQNSDKVDGFHASLTPAPNTIIPLNADGILDLSSTYIRSNVYTFRRVDLTNAASDYMLQVGEEAYISFNNATSVPLHIATQSGTYYECHLVCSNTGGTSGSSGHILLNPNNTTYTNAFKLARYIITSNGAYSFYETYSGFPIGRAFTSSTFTITNFLQYKGVKGLFNLWGEANTFPSLTIFSSDWQDTTTAWTSLGTIIFPYTTSGYILVRRLA